MSEDSMQIDLLRHGEVVGGTRFRGSQDDPLSPLGWEQMQAAVADREPWTAVITSPLSRCRAFAESLARSRGIRLGIDERLREIHFGDWEGRDYGELMASAPLALTRFLSDPYRYPPPGAELLGAFRERTLQALADILGSKNSGGCVLVVTHGGVIRTMLCHARRWPLSRLLEIEVPHASLHRLHGYGKHCTEVKGWP